jgi:hypothetical protein
MGKGGYGAGQLGCFGCEKKKNNGKKQIKSIKYLKIVKRKSVPKASFTV